MAQSYMMYMMAELLVHWCKSCCTIIKGMLHFVATGTNSQRSHAHGSSSWTPCWSRWQRKWLMGILGEEGRVERAGCNSGWDDGSLAAECAGSYSPFLPWTSPSDISLDASWYWSKENHWWTMTSSGPSGQASHPQYAVCASLAALHAMDPW